MNHSRVWIYSQGRWADIHEVAWKVTYAAFHKDDGDNVPDFKARIYKTFGAAELFARKESKSDDSAFSMATIDKQVLEQVEGSTYDWTNDDSSESIHYNMGERE